MLLALALSLSVNRTWSSPTLLVSLANAAVNESSGVGASTKYPGVYYTHNDSGDTARFFRFKADGAVTVVNVTGASATDWEDMACVKVGTKNYLYFADFGDNNANRANVKVYRMEEPGLTASAVSTYDTFTITYPDGPHNCEAIIVDPATGDIYFATKKNTECVVYRLGAPASSGNYALTRLGVIHPDTGGGNMGKLVTAGSADPSGSHVILRTYTGALEFKVSGPFADWWKQTPIPVAMPAAIQGESIAYGPTGRVLLTTSEGTPCPVHQQKVIESVGKG